MGLEVGAHWKKQEVKQEQKQEVAAGAAVSVAYHGWRAAGF